jgi:hypothetical protein
MPLQSTILSNLRDPDVSIRRRALDLLFTMCDGGAAVEVVEELVSRWLGCTWDVALYDVRLLYGLACMGCEVMPVRLPSADCLPAGLDEACTARAVIRE